MTPLPDSIWMVEERAATLILACFIYKSRLNNKIKALKGDSSESNFLKKNPCNCSVGLRIYCADRTKTIGQQAKIPIAVGNF